MKSALDAPMQWMHGNQRSLKVIEKTDFPASSSDASFIHDMNVKNKHIKFICDGIFSKHIIKKTAYLIHEKTHKNDDAYA